MRRSRRQRDNPKVRKVVPPLSGTDPDQVAVACGYGCSPHHKDRPGFAGMPPGCRSDAGICPGDLANERDRIESRLRDAARAGRTGARTGGGGFPRYIWRREGGTVFEARHDAPGSGRYRGYPLRAGQHVRGLP